MAVCVSASSCAPHHWPNVGDGARRSTATSNTAPATQRTSFPCTCRTWQCRPRSTPRTLSDMLSCTQCSGMPATAYSRAFHPSRNTPRASPCTTGASSSTSGTRMGKTFISLPRATQRLESRNTARALRPQCVPYIPIELKAEPELGAHPGNAGKTQGGIGGDAALAAHDLVQSWKRDAQPDGEGRLGDLERLGEPPKQHLTRSHGREVRRKAAMGWRQGRTAPPSGNP